MTFFKNFSDLERFLKIWAKSVGKLPQKAALKFLRKARKTYNSLFCAPFKPLLALFSHFWPHSLVIHSNSLVIHSNSLVIHPYSLVIHLQVNEPKLGLVRLFWLFGESVNNGCITCEYWVKLGWIWMNHGWKLSEYGWILSEYKPVTQRLGLFGDYHPLRNGADVILWIKTVATCRKLVSELGESLKWVDFDMPREKFRKELVKLSKMVVFQAWEFENADFSIFHSINLRSILNCREKSTESCEVM